MREVDFKNHISLGLVWEKSSRHKVLSDEMTEILRTPIFRPQLIKKTKKK